MKPVYVAEAEVAGGQQGKGATNDGRLSVDLSTPKELGGSGGQGTNPEQLFAIGYAASYEGAVRAVTQQKDLPIGGISVTARVTLGKTEFGMELAVQLRVTIPGVPREEAESLMAEAHMICPYSRATRGNIAVTFSVDAP